MSDKRHNARIFCLQRLFEDFFQQTDQISPLKDTLSDQELFELNDLKPKEVDMVLYKKLLDGITQHFSELDKMIKDFAPEWPLEKIAKLDLQILRIAIFEGFLAEITPKRVAIDEAIELSKEFSNDQSRKFISGVLGSLYEKNKNKDD